MTTLVVTLGRKEVSRHPLRAVPLRIGSGPDVDIRLDPRGVDAVHAEIGRIEDRVLVRDLSALNGVLVNGSKVDLLATVAPGDVLNIGLYRLALEDPGNGAAKRDQRRTGVAVGRWNLAWGLLGLVCVAWLVFVLSGPRRSNGPEAILRAWELAGVGERDQARALLLDVRRSAKLSPGDREVVRRMSEWIEREMAVDRGGDWLAAGEVDSALVALLAARRSAPEDPEIAALVRRAIDAGRRNAERPESVASTDSVVVQEAARTPLGSSVPFSAPVEQPLGVDVAGPAMVRPGQVESLRVRVSGGEVSTWNWAADRGEVRGAGGRVEYVAPSVPGADWIRLDARSSDGGRVTVSVPVTVSPWPLDEGLDVPVEARVAFWKGYRLATDARSRDPSAAKDALGEAIAILDDPSHPYAKRASALLQSLEAGP